VRPRAGAPVAVSGLLALGLAPPAGAQAEPQQPPPQVVVVPNPNAPPAPTPVEHADELLWKLTGSAYFVPHDAAMDFNVRHQLGHFGAWLGLFSDPGGDTVGRTGVEWGDRFGPAFVLPTLQVATNGLVAGQLYSELGGGSSYAILGASRTNLRPFYNLSWDPNESVQLGLGHRFDRFDKLYAFTIFDVRLHTGQQDTHLLYRHRVGARLGVTLDTLYKSGHLDSGRYVKAVGVGFYVDGPHWLAKAYYDPYVNFSNQTMFRVAVGAKL